MDDEDKRKIILGVNVKIGSDINDLVNAHEYENELVLRKNHLQNCLNEVSNEVPIKLSAAIEKAENNTKQIEDLKVKSDKFKTKVESFLIKTEPLRNELTKHFSAINKLEEVLAYLKSFEKIDDLSQQMKQCNDDEQVIQLYGEMIDMCRRFQKGHRGNYLKDYTHYWHNILKDKLSKQYEDVMKLLKWPFTTTSVPNSPPPKEVLMKFTNLTRHLFLIEEPEVTTAAMDSLDFLEFEPCLPVRILLRPLKKRFTFHFSGTRQTARIDRPEWFLTQTLTWIKDHQAFVKKHVQPVADKLQMKNIRAVDEFNAGIIALAAERLHTVLGLYQLQGAKGEIVDVDAAFAHAVDETLGFHRELTAVTEKEMNGVLSVLTKAETFVHWLAVEKKYALVKMDEILGNEQWSEAVAAGVGAAVGALLWVPRGADWFIALLKTIEDRYTVLPQPGHRLQFLELQLELVEEWRVRLTQLLSAALDTLRAESFLTANASPHQLIAVINAAHYTRTVLLQWAHSLHYLQLHYYRRQFQQFTQLQHHEESSGTVSCSEEDTVQGETPKRSHMIGDNEESLSLEEVEHRARKLALNEVSRQNSTVSASLNIIMSPVSNMLAAAPTSEADIGGDMDESDVFAEAPLLLARLRDAGLRALADHVLLEFKASFRDYKKQKWHAMVTVEQQALCVSPPLCRPLGALCARLAHAGDRLAPPLTAGLRARIAADIDHYIFEEVALANWFNPGGILQFTHDVKRNLVPALAPPTKPVSQLNQLPKLLEACVLLNLDYDDARKLRALLNKELQLGTETLLKLEVTHISPAEAQQILGQRTDLRDSDPAPRNVMELF